MLIQGTKDGKRTDDRSACCAHTCMRLDGLHTHTHTHTHARHAPPLRPLILIPDPCHHKPVTHQVTAEDEVDGGLLVLGVCRCGAKADHDRRDEDRRQRSSPQS